jgi:elongation factor Ts
MKTEIDAKTVKKLRDETGAGMMNCKKALLDNNGDYEKAIESLRLKGMATADKKASRNTNEGLIYSYIHTGNKLGILIEVNCETDFVARREEFSDLVKFLLIKFQTQ